MERERKRNKSKRKGMEWNGMESRDDRLIERIQGFLFMLSLPCVCVSPRVVFEFTCTLIGVWVCCKITYTRSRGDGGTDAKPGL